ncbi:MAG: SRPBCC domain-containing protein, partial [Marmoricola sp.]
MPHPTTTVLRRSLPVPPERIWQLWTTPAGIGAWWAPDGFSTTVDTLELRPGGSLDYTMTATGPDQVAFMEQAGMPLANASHKEFTEVDAPCRLAYLSLVDFVPGTDAYQHLTTVTLERTDTGTDVVMEC